MPRLSDGTREFCISFAIAHSRSRLDHGSGGARPHMNTTGPGVSNGSRDSCVPYVDPQSRQSPGRGSGGVGPHCYTSDLPDDCLSISPHHPVPLVFPPLVALPMVTTTQAQPLTQTCHMWKSALTCTDPRHDTALFSVVFPSLRAPCRASLMQSWPLKFAPMWPIMTQLGPMPRSRLALSPLSDEAPGPRC